MYELHLNIFSVLYIYLNFIHILYISNEGTVVLVSYYLSLPGCWRHFLIEVNGGNLYDFIR